jgi:hypothetical protein
MTGLSGIPNPSARLRLCLALVLTVSACASETVYVDLSYPPEKEMAYAELATSVNALDGPEECTLILEISDEREEKVQIGLLHLGIVGESYAPVLTEDNVPIWIRDAATHELELLGFSVLEDGAVDADHEAESLLIGISEVSTGCYATGCQATVVLTVRPDNPDIDPAFVESKGEESAHGFSAYVKLASRALQRALQESIRMLLKDFGYLERSEQACA